MCVCVCARSHTCTRTVQKAREGCPIPCSITVHLILLRLGLSMNLKFTILSTLATLEHLGSLCLSPLQGCGVAGIPLFFFSLHLIECGHWGFELGSSCLTNKLSYPLSHVSSPELEFDLPSVLLVCLAVGKIQDGIHLVT